MLSTILDGWRDFEVGLHTFLCSFINVVIDSSSFFKFWISHYLLLIPTKMVNILKLCKQSFSLYYIEVRTHLKIFHVNAFNVLRKSFIKGRKGGWLFNYLIWIVWQYCLFNIQTPYNVTSDRGDELKRVLKAHYYWKAQ